MMNEFLVVSVDFGFGCNYIDQMSFMGICLLHDPQSFFAVTKVPNIRVHFRNKYYQKQVKKSKHQQICSFLAYQSKIKPIVRLQIGEVMTLSFITFEMTQLQIEAQGLPNQLAFRIKYPDVPNITFNFRLDIKVNRQSLKGQLTQVYHKNMYVPQKQIRIKPLEGNFIYKLQIDLNTNNRAFKKNAFTFVPKQVQDDQSQQNNDYIQQQYEIPPRSLVTSNPRQTQTKFRPQKSKVKEELADPFSRSQDFMRMVGRSVGITDSKKLDKYILEGRKCRNTTQFLNSQKQFQNGNAKKTIQKHKMLLKGKMVFRDVYKQSQGQAFFKNDWFMGPFYSYDNNEKKLVKE